MAEEVVLDKSAFKALAVDTRVNILKILGTRRHTQSELAASLNMSVPTVKEHLDALVKAELVERQDDGHKWIYYALSKKGKAILNPEERKFWILLSTTIITIAGGVTAWFRSTHSYLYVGTAAPAVQPVAQEAAPMLAKSVAPEALAMDSALAAEAAPKDAFPWGWFVLGTLVALQLAFLLYFWIKSRRNKKLLD